MQMSDTSPNSNGHQRVKRTKFTDQQLQVLNSAFELENYPREDTFERLAHQTGLNVRTVTVWFQNARQKYKRHSVKHKSEQEIPDNSSKVVPEQSPGDFSRLLMENPIMYAHFIGCLNMMNINNQNYQQNSNEGDTVERDKRFRTPISAKQVSELTELFKKNSSPNSAELNQISKNIKLSKKVVQVWFQNARAREKKLNQDKVASQDLARTHSQEVKSETTDDDHKEGADEDIPPWKMAVVEQIVSANPNPSPEQVKLLGDKLGLSGKFIASCIAGEGSQGPSNDKTCMMCSNSDNGSYSEHVWTDEHITNVIKSHLFQVDSTVKREESSLTDFSQFPNNMCSVMPHQVAFFNLMYNYNSNGMIQSTKLTSLVPYFVVERVISQYFQNLFQPIFYSEKNETLTCLVSKLHISHHQYASSVVLYKFYHCRLCDEAFDVKYNYACNQHGGPNGGLMIYKIGWKCLICDVTYEYQSELVEHISANH